MSKRTARELGTDSTVLVRMVGDEGIAHAWDEEVFATRHARLRSRSKV